MNEESESVQTILIKKKKEEKGRKIKMTSRNPFLTLISCLHT